MAKKKSKSKPEITFRAGNVSVSVWKNKSKDDEIFYNVSGVQKSFKDKDDEWQNTNNLNVFDLPKAILVLQDAFKWISYLKPESEDEDEDEEIF